MCHMKRNLRWILLLWAKLMWPSIANLWRYNIWSIAPPIHSSEWCHYTRQGLPWLCFHCLFVCLCVRMGRWILMNILSGEMCDWQHVITLRAKHSGAVYCYRSCLCICNGRAVFVCGFVTTITLNRVHQFSPNWVCR